MLYTMPYEQLLFTTER